MRSLSVLVVVSFAVVGSGCAPTMYTPEPYHLPLHDSTGDVQIRGTLHGESVSASVSGTPLPHLVVFGAGSISDSLRHVHRTWEGGVGTYVSLPDALTAELLAGWGGGSVSGKGTNILGTDAYRIDGRLQRRFAQVNVGAANLSSIVGTHSVDVGVGLRLSSVRLTNLHYRNTSSPLPRTRGLFLEPLFSFTRHVNGVGVHFSLAFSEAVRPFADPLVHDPWEFGLGLSFRPHRFFASKD